MRMNMYNAVVCLSNRLLDGSDDDYDDNVLVVADAGDDGGYGNYGRINFMLYLYAYHF